MALFYLPHTMFHRITYYVSEFTPLNLNISAVLVNTFLVIALATIIDIIISVFVKDINLRFKLFLVVVVLYSSTFFLPGLGLTNYQYIGNGSISIWHNVTIYMVKPFAFISIFLLFHEESFNKKHLLFFSLMSAVLSIFAKPSFILIYLPMTLLYTTFSFFNCKKDKFKTLLIYFVVLFIFSAFVLRMQYLGQYTTNPDSKVLLAPFEVLKIYSKNIPISLFISNIFVVSFILLAFKFCSCRTVFAFIMLIGGA